MRKVLAVVLASILFLDAVSLGVILLSKAKELPDPAIPVTETEPKDDLFARAKVIAVGDNIIHEEIFRQAKARSISGGYDFDFVYENLREKISGADAALITQESAVSQEHGVSAYPLFNAPAEIADELYKLGFTVVNVATNHALDFGEKGLKNTLQLLKEKGLNPIGAYESKEAAGWLNIQDVNGIKIAWLGFTQALNGHSLPEDAEVSLELAEYETHLNEMITLADRKADIVIVCAHWGNEYETQVTESQRSLAQKLGEWGADIIIGSHPHVLQSVEYLDNSDGSKTLVAYSLGNFVSAMTKPELMLGGLLSFDVVKNIDTKEITVENVSVEGVVTHYGLNTSKIRLYALSDYKDELANSHGIKEKSDEFSLRYLNDTMSSAIDRQFLK